MDKKDNGQAGVAALERGLSILEAFKKAGDILSLAELASFTGLYKSTILRLSASLLRFGFLQRLEDGRFRLGPSVFQLGRIYQRSFHLADAVLPVLRNMVAKTDETASFYIRDGEGDTCLFRVDSPRPVRDAGVVEGDRFPIDKSAASRVLSAFSGASGREYDAIRRQITVVTRRSLRVPGAAAVVCPVFTVDQKVAGAIVLSGPESRLPEKALANIRALVIEQAAHLTQTLGGDASIFDRIKAK